MKKTIVFIVAALLFCASTAFAGKGFPMTLAGITLGQDINKYAALIDLQQASPQSDAPFLDEARLKADSIAGIRGGSLDYGNCNMLNQLVRIKLKFNDPSQAFFDKLLKKYTAQYGDADSYQGDAFKNVIAWQWNFTQGEERIALVLMWSRDKEIRPGVSIKMTLESALDKEYDCYKDKSDKAAAKSGGPSQIKNINEFIPR